MMNPGLILLGKVRHFSPRPGSPPLTGFVFGFRPPPAAEGGKEGD